MNGDDGTRKVVTEEKRTEITERQQEPQWKYQDETGAHPDETQFERVITLPDGSIVTVEQNGKSTDDVERKMVREKSKRESETGEITSYR